MPKNETTQILMLRRREHDIIKRINERPISEPTPVELSQELEAIQKQIYSLQKLGLKDIDVPLPNNPPEPVSEVQFHEVEEEEKEEKPKSRRKKKDVVE